MTNVTIIEDLTLVPIPAWWQNPWVLLGLAVALGVIGYLLRRWWLSRPVPVVATPSLPPGPPPHLEALRRLAELRGKHAKVSAYEVSLECSDILRHYIEGRFALPIRYQTTREFLGAAQAQPELNNAQQLELGEFLQFFDAIKFARENATAEQTLGAIDYAERFIRRCIPNGSPENGSGK